MHNANNNNRAMQGRRLGGVLAAFAMSLLTLESAYASDTEVYARRAVLAGAAAPVLMMVLDTSDDMNKCLDGSTSCAGQSNSRVATLGKVMQKVLFGNPVYSASTPVIKPAPGYVHMGYSRFNPNANDGGWVRYPADKSLDTTLSGGLANVNLSLPVASREGDADTGSVTGSSFVLGNNSPDVGLVFTGLDVPQNAVITSATVTFSKASNGQNPDLSVLAESGGNANASFTASDLSARSYGSSFTAAYADTSTAATVDVTAALQEAVNRGNWCGGNNLGLKLVSGNSNRTATLNSFEGAVASTPSAAKPALNVTYTMSAAGLTNTCMTVDVVKSLTDVPSGVDATLQDVEWAESGSTAVDYSSLGLQAAAIPDGVRNMAGARFTQVRVPKNATITAAWLYSTGRTEASVTGVKSTVAVDAFNTDDLAPFCTKNSTTKVVSCSIPDQSSMTAATTFDFPSYTVVSPAPIDSYTTNDNTNFAANVQPQVQAIVNRPGWNSGQSLGFRLYNSNAAATSSPLALSSANAAASRAMTLHVRYQLQGNLSGARTVRQDLAEDISQRLFATGGTPLGDTFAEAARYMLGMPAYEENTFTYGGQNYAQPDARTVTGARTTTNPDRPIYRSPISTGSECSGNYIYMMSDADPADASNVNNNSNGVTSGFNAACNAYTSASSGNANANFSCMMSVAKHLSSGRNQLNKIVRTNTVFFGPSPSANTVSDMTDIAKTQGGGNFYLASDEAALTQSVLDTLSSLIDVSGSVTAPGVAVNQFNRLTHLDQLYYAVFDPDALHARWLGNVKRYRLAFGTTTASIVDVNGNNAIDPTTSFFATGAQSYWSPAVDGNKADQGGAASVLPAPGNRTIYSNPDGSNTLVPLQVNLGTMSAANISSATTAAGLTSTPQLQNLVNWILGYKIDIVQPAILSPATPATIKNTAVTVSNSTLLRRQVGGVLHSQPVLVNYGYTGGDPVAAASNASLQTNMVFFSDMEGMLHGLDANSGVETFAFMPRETLAREKTIVLNGSQDPPEFGLDLTWTVYRVDGNNDGQINNTSLDKVYLYGGMRMGGRNYYAMDATTRTAPTLLWQAKGGSANEFNKLGQTWSKPVIGRIKVAGVAKTVLFFGGGYDPLHEDESYLSATGDTMGNQVYIVDPQTGNVLWWASSSNSTVTSPTSGAYFMQVSDLKNSIPSELKTFDANNDGFVDALYFADLGGQVFRIDLDNGNAGVSSLAKRVQLLANLGQGFVADQPNQRRFYELPSVAPVKDSAGNPYVAVALGSGYRSHPLNTNAQDAFYVLRDNDALRSDLLTTTSLQTTLTPTDLATVNLATTSGTTNTKGWKLVLPETGEKVLSSAIILFGEVFFTTYVPDLNVTSTSCQPIGRSKLWRMSVTDAAVIMGLTNADGTLSNSGRTKDNAVQGLGGAPELVVGAGGKNAIITGTGVERNSDFGTAGAKRIRWYPKQ